MITKAFVDKVISPYKIRIRIPILDGISNSSHHTNSEFLNVAPICTLPNCNMNLKENDIVFVSVEDHSWDDAIVIGVLYTEKISDTYCDLILNELEVKSKVKLPASTSIGQVDYSHLSKLLDVNENLQLQLDDLKSDLTALKRKVRQQELMLQQLTSADDVESE